MIPNKETMKTLKVECIGSCVLILILVLIWALSGCGRDDVLTNATSVTTEAITAETTTEGETTKKVEATTTEKETTKKVTKAAPVEIKTKVTTTKSKATTKAKETTKSKATTKAKETTKAAVTTTKTTTTKTSNNTYYDVPLSKDLQSHIINLCKKHNIDPKLVIAIIKKESNYKSSAMGDSGASYGLMQIKKKYHTDRMSKLGCTNLLDPYQNVKVGIDYLAELYSTGKGTKWVLMAYNGGPSVANRNAANGVTTNYAKTVLYYRDCIK